MLRNSKFSSSFFQQDLSLLQLANMVKMLPQVNIVFETGTQQRLGLSTQFDGGNLEAVMKKADASMYSLQMNVTSNYVMILAVANGKNHEDAERLLDKALRQKEGE